MVPPRLWPASIDPAPEPENGEGGRSRPAPPSTPARKIGPLRLRLFTRGVAAVTQVAEVAVSAVPEGTAGRLDRTRADAEAATDQGDFVAGVHERLLFGRAER